MALWCSFFLLQIYYLSSILFNSHWSWPIHFSCFRVAEVHTDNWNARKACCSCAQMPVRSTSMHQACLTPGLVWGVCQLMQKLFFDGTFTKGCGLGRLATSISAAATAADAASSSNSLM